MDAPTSNPYPHIAASITQDLQGISASPIQALQLIRAKDDVYVYRCLYNGTPAVVKYLARQNDRREILNYRILMRHSIPTIKTYALGNATIVMEDISASPHWRLGIAQDLQDADVAKSLALWYFTFHENGATVAEMDSLYFEYDSLTKVNFELAMQKFPEASELFQFLLTHYATLRNFIFKPSFTLTYNDFYWTNFVVRQDKTAAKMFDYNLLGKGYRHSDFRNVCWDMSANAKAAFINEYNRLYFVKHKQNRAEAEKLEQRVDNVVSDLYMLILAFTEKSHIPNWAKDEKIKAVNGDLLARATQLLL